MSDLRIYIIMRGEQIVAAFSSPVTASMYLMREPSGLKLKSIVVQDMQSEGRKHETDFTTPTITASDS